MLNIDPGELTERITILRKIYPPADVDGYSAPALEPIRTCWAKVTDRSGKEENRDSADFSTVTLRFLVRTRPDLDRKMVVRCGGLDYEITHVAPLGLHGAYAAIYARRSTMEVT